MSQRREVEICIISDIHLGTYGCRAKELNRYLRSIRPKKLIINGDWFDIWNFSANHWPHEHTENLFLVLDYVRSGIPVYYITGNHDDAVRRFSNFSLDGLHILDELVIDIDKKKYWIFHGDIFDLSVGGKAKWLAKLGGRSYDYLIRLNRIINYIRRQLDKEPIMLSKQIKDSVKRVVKKSVADFEEIAIDHAIDHNYDYVVCGHIHKPQIREVIRDRGKTIYMNSGDWIENCTALEYKSGDWDLFYYYNELQYKGVRRDS